MVYPYVGIGINQLSYYDGAFAMADLVRESQFRDNTWGVAVNPDANGAPATDFLLIFSASKIAAGTYKLSFTGQANVGVAATPGGTIQNKIYTPSTNTTTADMVLPSASTGNNWLSFSNTRRTTASTTADGVTNIKLWRPGYATNGSALFTAEFIAAMQKFQFIRTMDFVVANQNATQTWAERTHIDFLGSTGTKGQSWELMILLANTTGNDLWLNVPVKADDNYLLQLAQLLRYGSDGVTPYTSPQANPVYPPLKAGLKVYLEYGNEVWNSGGGFNGFGWALALGNSHIADPTHPINYDGTLLTVADQYMALRRWIAYRSSVISLTFRSVFGDAAMMTTVRPVLSSQVGNANAYLSEGLKWADGFYSQVRSSPANPVVRRVNEIWYAGGGAAYYDSSSAPIDTQPVTMTNYFAGLPSPVFATKTATDAMWTRAYGLKTMAYEGGPGPGGSSLGAVTGVPASLAYIYNADPRMKDRMLAAHNIWQANGGEGLSYYVYSAAAYWNFSSDPSLLTASDTNSIKLQAITALRALPVAPVTLGAAVPATILFNDPTTTKIAGGFPGFVFTPYLPTGAAIGVTGNFLKLDTFFPAEPSKSGMFIMPIRNTSSTASNFKFSIKTINAKATDRIELLINGISAGVWNMAASSTPGIPVQSTAIAANLPTGLNLLRVRVVLGSGVAYVNGAGVYVNALVVQ